MNCQLCQKNSDAYRGGRLSEDMKTQVEAHLHICEECSENYKRDSFADHVINQEKIIKPDAYITARIMARIENLEESGSETNSPFTRILRPALIMTSMAAAIFLGVLIGNIYRPSYGKISKPVELALIDDVAIESIDILSNE